MANKNKNSNNNYLSNFKQKLLEENPQARVFTADNQIGFELCDTLQEIVIADKLIKSNLGISDKDISFDEAKIWFEKVNEIDQIIKEAREIAVEILANSRCKAREINIKSLRSSVASLKQTKQEKAKAN